MPAPAKRSTPRTRISEAELCSSVAIRKSHAESKTHVKHHCKVKGVPNHYDNYTPNRNFGAACRLDNLKANAQAGSVNAQAILEVASVCTVLTAAKKMRG
jgi:hypothetical protein